VDREQLSPDERLASLETAEEARNLLVAYGRGCDRHDAHSFVALFADDMVLTAGAEARWEGRDAVVEFYRAAFDPPEAQRHFITNVTVTERSPQTATIHSYFIVVRSSKGRSLLGWGSYCDTFKRVDGSLQFASKHITLDWLDDVKVGWVAALDDATPVPQC
jgi:uncharacterized protein (TIGR02246 family)